MWLQDPLQATAHNPAVLFIGFQPGGSNADEEAGERDGWKSDLEYVTAEWKLATNMRAMWCSSGLSACVGIIAIFVRIPQLMGERKSMHPNTSFGADV